MRNDSPIGLDDLHVNPLLLFSDHHGPPQPVVHVWCLVEGEAGVWSKIVLCLASHAQGLSTGSSAEGRDRHL